MIIVIKYVYKNTVTALISVLGLKCAINNNKSSQEQRVSNCALY